VALSRRLVELGRAARAESKIKIRQPLARALLSAAGVKNLDREIIDQIAEELNVVAVDTLSAENEELVSISIKANFRSIGERYGAAVQAIAKAITATDATALVHAIRAAGTAELSYGDDLSATLSEADLVITETPKSGWSVASHSGESVALDLTLTPELISAGLVREVIRAIQERRKQDGFDISDRIKVNWNANEDIAKAINSRSDEISNEVLALELVQVSSLEIPGEEFALALELKKA
jgi:isoleucyl-tRNA synthetase